MGGERWPGIDCLCMRDHSQKNWESVYVWKLSVKSIRIRPIYLRIIERYSCLLVELPSTVEDNRRVYEAKDAFLRLLTSFGKSVRYEVLSFACLNVNKASWVQGGVSYVVIFLVSLLGSLTIAKFNGLSLHCFVVVNFS